MMAMNDLRPIFLEDFYMLDRSASLFSFFLLLPSLELSDTQVDAP